MIFDYYLVDVHDDKLELAKNYGAEIVINAKKEDPGKKIKVIY